jgi:transcriptional regulator with XRE-family HTH domain
MVVKQMTLLRDARRARGWSQAQLMHALRRQAAEEGLAVPSAESLRIMVSRWENGRIQPDETYRRYLCAAYGTDATSLGLRDTGPRIGGGPLVPAAPLRVSEPLLWHLDRSLEEYVVADNALGAEAILPLVEQQAGLLDGLASHAGGRDRTDVLVRASRYSELCGWLRQDVGDIAGAQRWSDRALEYVDELGDVRQLSYVLMRKSNIASDRGQPARALGLAEAALRPGTTLTPRLRAVALRQQAAAYASTGDAALCARALDRAEEEIASADVTDTHAGYVSAPYIASEAGQCWLALGAPKRAEETLRRGLAAWPDGHHRDRGIGLCRLASALLSQRSVDEAAHTTRQAIDVADLVASPRLHAQLYTLRQRLQRWRSVASVASVTDAMADLSNGRPT